MKNLAAGFASLDPLPYSAAAILAAAKNPLDWSLLKIVLNSLAAREVTPIDQLTFFTAIEESAGVID